MLFPLHPAKSRYKACGVLVRLNNHLLRNPHSQGVHQLNGQQRVFPYIPTYQCELNGLHCQTRNLPMLYTIRFYPPLLDLGIRSCHKVYWGLPNPSGCGEWHQKPRARLGLVPPHVDATHLPFSAICRVRLPSFWQQECLSCATQFRQLHLPPLWCGTVYCWLGHRDCFQSLAVVVLI